MPEVLHFPDKNARALLPYLPQPPQLPALGELPRGPEAGKSSSTKPAPSRPFVTLTFATSLDSSLALAPGTRTRLSGPESKAMTHYLRSRHDGICIGVNTAIADDPALNCRIALGEQPQPIIIDPQARWNISDQSKVLQVARDGSGKGPIIVTGNPNPPHTYLRLINEVGGKFLTVKLNESGRFEWPDIFAALFEEGLRSLMIEGGASVINSLLEPVNQVLVDSVIVTIAPTWLGQGSVVVSPDRVHDNGVPVPAARLSHVAWHPLGEDVVLCGRF